MLVQYKLTNLFVKWLCICRHHMYSLHTQQQQQFLYLDLIF